MSDVQNLLEFLSPPPFSLKRFELKILYLTLIFKSCPYVELIRCLNRIHLFWKIFIFYVILKILFRKMQKQTLSYYVHISWIYTLLNIKHFDQSLFYTTPCLCTCTCISMNVSADFRYQSCWTNRDNLWPLCTWQG